MLYELALFGAIVASAFFLTGCAKKKAPTAVSAAAKTKKTSSSKAPVDEEKKDEEKDGEKKDGEKKDTEKGDGEKKDEKKESKEEDKKENNDKEEKKDDEKEEKKDENDDKKDSKEKKDDEKKDSKEKKDDDKKDSKEKKDDDKKDGKEEKKDDGKKGDPLISADPPDIKFDRATTNQKKLRIKNVANKKVMFKVKATTTNAYLINPVFGVIEANKSAEIIITHRPSQKREDKLVIISAEMTGKELEMAKTFKQLKNTGPEISVKLVAA